jgi:serine/threonine-protein kinase
MSDEDRSEEFTDIWETFGLQETVADIADTQTMKPSDQTRIATDGGGSFARKLPSISGHPEDSTLPEVQFGRKLGEGGTAEVHAAEQVPLGREVAVKQRRPDRKGTQATDVLLQEAWVTGQLEHPNIVPVYRLGRDDDAEPVLVMKRISGVPWRDLLEDPSVAPREFDSEDPLDWHLEILSDVCDAIRYAHNRSIIHRDLKPDNVMIGAFGEIYVLDWGMAVSVADREAGRIPDVDAIDEPAGTPAYMAPEMAAGDGSRHGLQTDVYLLGAILHRIVTGEVPHGGDSMFEIMHAAYDSEPHEYGPDVPDRLAEICRKAMARDPEDRYRSADEFQHALVSFKRHRQSLELSRRAEDRLEHFHELADNEGDREGSLYEVFGECRFGFERALEVDETNTAAREGLQEVMVRMIERELEQDGLKAASLLLADLPEPRPDLEERLETRKSARQDREREFEKLKEREREHDVEQGRRARSIFVFAIGVVWAAISYAPSVMTSVLDLGFGYGGLFVQMAIVSLIIALGLYIGRQQLFQNTVNRQLVAGLLWIVGGAMITRKATMQLGVPLEQTMIHEMLISGIGAGIIGVCLDRRVLWVALPCFAGGLLATEMTDQVPVVAAVTDFSALTLLAILWWPGTLESFAGPIGQE